LIWQSRVCLEIYFLVFGLENSTHVAQRRRTAMPNGHQSFDRLAALRRCKRVFHFLTARKKHYFAAAVKKIILAQTSANALPESAQK
jgi:hypothetical protein